MNMLYIHTYTPLCGYGLSTGPLTASARGGRDIGHPRQPTTTTETY